MVISDVQIVFKCVLLVRKLCWVFVQTKYSRSSKLSPSTTKLWKRVSSKDNKNLQGREQIVNTISGIFCYCVFSWSWKLWLIWSMVWVRSLEKLREVSICFWLEPGQSFGSFGQTSTNWIVSLLRPISEYWTRWFQAILLVFVIW